MYPIYEVWAERDFLSDCGNDIARARATRDSINALYPDIAYVLVYSSEDEFTVLDEEEEATAKEQEKQDENGDHLSD